MAAPRKVDRTGKHRGDAFLTIRLTSSQLKELKKDAKKKSVSVGQLVRLRALNSRRAA